MNRRVIAIIVIVIVSVGLGLWKLNKDSLLLWNSNSLKVTADKPLIADKVKIEFGICVNTISRSNDLDLLKNREKYTLLFDGKKRNSMINEYGENDFLITYDNKYYFSFRHFKYNRRHQHDYHFHIYQKNNKVYIQTDIIGKDAMKFERPMLEIKNSSNNWSGDRG